MEDPQKRLCCVVTLCPNNHVCNLVMFALLVPVKRTRKNLSASLNKQMKKVINIQFESFQGSQREHSRKVEDMAYGSEERVSGRNKLGMFWT